MRLVSKPFTRRTGLIPLMVALGAGWIFVLVWSLVLTVIARHNFYWTVGLSISTFAFACFLASMTYSLVNESTKEYVFELNDTEAVLSTHDKMRKTDRTQMVLLDDVTYVEYYPYCDSSCIILHAPYCEFEVPLYPLGPGGKDVVDFLIGRGLKVMNVQLDDRVPV
jgi:hypothetical protein